MLEQIHGKLEGPDELPNYYIELYGRVKDAFHKQNLFSKDDRDEWDTKFRHWINNQAPLNDLEIPKPGNHPWRHHPWNKGIFGQKYYLVLEGKDPELISEDDEEIKQTV